MRWVPAGSFDFGDTLYPEEQPVQKTTVAGFWIDRTEVTNDAFSADRGSPRLGALLLLRDRVRGRDTRKDATVERADIDAAGKIIGGRLPQYRRRTSLKKTPTES